jgi:putative NADH-flavin reductase
MFGANGDTGRLVVRRALDAGHSAVAVTRRPAEFPFRHPALTVTSGDVCDDAALPEVVADADAVLSSVGVPYAWSPIDTYSLGTGHVIDAMEAVGARRLVVVSSTGAYRDRRRPGTPWAHRWVFPVIAHTIARSTYDDIRQMETRVRASDLDWTIVRPSALFDAADVSDYVAGEREPAGACTARIDLADYMIQLAADPDTYRRTVTVSTLENAPSFFQVVRRNVF